MFLSLILSSCRTKNTAFSYSDSKVQKDKGIAIKMVSDDEYVIAKLMNISSKDKYLLTSYLNNRFTYNDNLYTTKGDTIIASFKPILNHLGTVKSDVLIVDDNSVLTEKQAIYEFLKIPPNEEVSIKFDKSEVNEVSNYEKGKIFIFEFAIYENVDLLKLRGVEYDKRYKKAFIEQAKDYKLAEIIYDR